MEDFIRVEDQFYILATSSRADDRTQVLKHDETFAVFDHYGDVAPFGLGEQGIYHQGTRFLSRLDLRVNGRRPLLLSSTVRDENDVLAADLTNPDISLDGNVVFPRGSLHIFRTKFLWQGACYERLLISNHGMIPMNLSISFRFEADFADIFEVRGVRRERKGSRLADGVNVAGIQLGYRGLDGVVRRTRIACRPEPADVSPGEVRYLLRVEPRDSFACYLTVGCEIDGEPSRQLPYEEAFAAATAELSTGRARMAAVETQSEQFNEWLSRSVADTQMMITRTRCGPFSYAGVPWFSTAFGRDGIIAALELLWVDPGVARGALCYLASTQATEVDPGREAEPGKILHEMRRGEMAALGEIPFGRYYGTVDATPLFVMLAGAYHRRTGDREFLESLWPHLELALRWTETYGDADGDGFVEYHRQSPRGLAHQGWKDSQDAVFHQDGSLAQGPIALCEVQGYVYAARRSAAELAIVLGHGERAQDLLRRAEELRDRFERTFWCDDLSTYALALDGEKRPCRVRSSNAGHCLFTGIASEERARRTGQTLLRADSFSGWGIRTISTAEARYNPMSYHNGSVWPHDNALIALGLARYGLLDLLLKTFRGMFEASAFLDLHRLPELFCGFPRRPGEGPTLYPVACAPQSWASASVFLFLQAALGLSIDAPRQRIEFVRPTLPDFLKAIQVQGLRVGPGSVDLLIERHRHDVSVGVMRNDAGIEVVVLK